MHRSIRRLAIGATLAGIAATGMPALASAAPTCNYDPSLKVVHVEDGVTTDSLRIARSGPLLYVQEGNGPQKLCPSPSFDFATVNNTNSVIVQGRATSSFDGYVIDQRDGALGPGATPEADGNSELEVTVLQRTNPAAEVIVLGTSQADNIRVTGPNRVMLGADEDVDINVVYADGRPYSAGGFTLQGGEGPDFLSGRGGLNPASRPPSPVKMHIFGEGDNDGLQGGTSPGDFLSGGKGGDVLFSLDGFSDDLVGGPDSDRATVDRVDRPSADIENVFVAN